MSPRIIDVTQGEDAWRLARIAIPTASMFSVVLAKGEGKTRTSYMHKLAGERLTGEPMESYFNADMQRGKDVEDIFRRDYAFGTDMPVTQVGFIVDDEMRCGASPDAMVGDDGLLEIKSAATHVLIAHVEADRFPSEHVAQTQGGLLVSGRAWIDLTIGHPHPALPRFLMRAVRDEPYLAKLRDELARFNDDLDSLVERIRGYGPGPSLAEALKESIAEGAG